MDKKHCHEKYPIICLMGPTASRKTDISINLNKMIPIEIISVDSALIYRNMNIGTSKPNIRILNKIPHHLINIIDPDETYSVAKFFNNIKIIINNIINKGKIPLLTGGTMMYFNIIQNGLIKNSATTAEIRKKAIEKINIFGLEKIYYGLGLDKNTIINKNDKQRICRSLEISMIGEKNKSEIDIINNKKINIALIPNDREIYQTAIKTRLNKMLNNGFIEEVLSIYKTKLINNDSPSMKCIGYKEIYDFIKNRNKNLNKFDNFYISHDELLDIENRIFLSTRQLAKRQLTWIKKIKNKKIFDPFTVNIEKKIIDYINNNL